MAILNFSDVLKNVGLDPKRVKLIRHSLGDKAFKKCYDKGMVEEYIGMRVEARKEPINNPQYPKSINESMRQI